MAHSLRSRDASGVFAIQAGIFYWQGRILKHHGSALEHHAGSATKQAATAELIKNLLQLGGRAPRGKKKRSTEEDDGGPFSAISSPRSWLRGDSSASSEI